MNLFGSHSPPLAASSARVSEPDVRLTSAREWLTLSSYPSGEGRLAKASGTERIAAAPSLTTGRSPRRRDERMVEVFRGQPRRRWSEEDKRRLVGEPLAPGQTVHGVARRRGVSPSQLFTWRKQLRIGPEP